MKKIFRVMHYWKEDITYQKEYDTYYDTCTSEENTTIEHNVAIKDFENLSDAQKFIINLELNNKIYEKDVKTYIGGVEHTYKQKIYLNGELYVMEVYADKLQF